MAPRIIAVVNHKGGTLKTTSTVNLAQSIVETDRTVRVIDMDEQASATIWLGLEPETAEHDVLSVIMRQSSIEQATVTTESGIQVVPATKELGNVNPYFMNKPGSHEILRRALSEAPDVDFTLIDCPGNFGNTTISALVASNEILVPVSTGSMELEAVLRIEDYIAEQVELLNPTARLNHIICGRVEMQQVIDQQVIAALRESYPDQLMKTIIPKSVRVTESYSAHEPVVTYSPSSTPARAYRDAAQELIERATQ